MVTGETAPVWVTVETTGPGGALQIFILSAHRDKQLQFVLCNVWGGVEGNYIYILYKLRSLHKEKWVKGLKVLDDITP